MTGERATKTKPQLEFRVRATGPGAGRTSVYSKGSHFGKAQKSCDELNLVTPPPKGWTETPDARSKRPWIIEARLVGAWEDPFIANERLQEVLDAP